MTQSDQRTCGTAAAPRRNDHKNLAGVNRAGHRGPPNTAGQGARVITRTLCYVRSIGATASATPERADSAGDNEVRLVPSAARGETGAVCS